MSRRSPADGGGSSAGPAGAAAAADNQPPPATNAWMPAPALLRRLAAFVYEGVLLFGVLMLAGFVYSSLTQQRHALQGKTGLQLFLFGVLGLYFSWFWSHGGQTVAMKAWHVRLIGADGAPVRQGRALLRYMLAWLWFVPALATAHFAGLQGGAAMAGILLAGVLAYAGLAWLRPDRQFWHDVVCATRLVDSRTALPAQAESPRP